MGKGCMCEMHTAHVCVTATTAETVQYHSNPGREAGRGAIIDFSPSQLGSYRM